MKLMSSVALSILLAGACAGFASLTAAQGEPYRFRPKLDTFGTSSVNIEIEESKDGINIKGLGKESKVASAVPFDGKGRSRYMPDAPGSHGIHIVVNPKIGYTTFAGLRFQDAAVAAVRKDGLVVVNKEGIRARDSAGRTFVSGKMVVSGTTQIVMLEKQ